MRRAGPAPAEEPVAQVFLKPAALYGAATPTIVTTVLGSCVAVCLWDRKRGIGGINHFVLPCGAAGEIDLRYGDAAIDQLVERMTALGAAREDLDAKIFGGAEVLAVGASENNVGAKNVALALAHLERHAISVTARRTGGESGLLIRFWTGTGHVLVRTIPA